MTTVSGVDDFGLLNKDEVLESLEKDPLLVNNNESKSNGDNDLSIDYESMLKKESSLNQELHDLNSLRSISGLIMEFKANYELLELENCYYSLQNLRKKLRDTSTMAKQSFSFQQSVFSHVDSMHFELVNKLHEIVSQHFWEVTEECIQFKQVLELGDESELLEYGPLITFLEQQYYPDGFLDSNHWIIRHMKVGVLQDAVLEKLNKILRDYLNFNLIIDSIKHFIFTKNGMVLYEKDDNSRRLLLRQGSDNKVNDRILNISNVVEFLNEGVSPHDKPVFAEKLGPLLANDLLQVVRSNAHLVLRSTNPSLRKEIELVNEKLQILSDNTRWNYRSDDVNHLLGDDQIYKNLLLDGIFENCALKVRSIFRDPSFKKLEKVSTGKNGSEETHVTVGSLSENRSVETKKSEKGQYREKEMRKEEDWDWGEDPTEEDGWDDELAINFEDSSGPTPRKPRRLSGKSGSDEVDGWDKEMEIDLDNYEDIPQKSRRLSQKSHKSQKSQKSQRSEGDGWEWDLDINEIENPPLAPITSNMKAGNERNLSSINHDFQISQMALTFIDLMKELEKTVEETSKSFPENHTYQHKLNVLQTFFFAISTRHFQQDWWQLFIDLRYVVKTNPRLTRLQELVSNLLETYSNSSLRVVTKLVDEQIQRFFDNGNHPNWGITEENLLPFVKTQIIDPLSIIGGDEGTFYLLHFYHCLYVESINDRILKWNVISEKNSENLSHLVKIIYDQTETSTLMDNAQYRQYRDKFAIVGQLLQLHLKEIMEMFYNGDFYLFDTEELVQWLILLFADTPLRQNAIQEIHDIRNASMGDD